MRVARTAVMWGSAALHAGGAAAFLEAGNVPALVVYAIATVGCIVAGRFLA